MVHSQSAPRGLASPSPEGGVGEARVAGVLSNDHGGSVRAGLGRSGAGRHGSCVPGSTGSEEDGARRNAAAPSTGGVMSAARLPPQPRSRAKAGVVKPPVNANEDPKIGPAVSRESMSFGINLVSTCTTWGRKLGRGSRRSSAVRPFGCQPVGKPRRKLRQAVQPSHSEPATKR